MNINSSVFTGNFNTQEEHRNHRYNRILKGINHIINIAGQENKEEEIRSTCLSVALEITDSKVGFIGEVDPDVLRHEITPSDMVWKYCYAYDKSGHQCPHRYFILNGRYGDIIKGKKSFFTNDPLSYPDSTDMSYGHTPLTSFLGVPLIEKGKAIGMLAVANHEGGYNSEQLEDLESIAPAMVEALQRKKAEKSLVDAYEQIRVQSETLQEQNEALQAQKLRESKARIDSIFRSSPIGIGVVVDRMIKEANERLCEMTGYSREELLGKSALMLYPTVEEYERVGRVKYGMIAERGTGQMETRWRRKDGSVVDIILSSSPIIPGNLSGEITFTAQDITDRKRAEEALKKAHDTLEEKIKERTAELEEAYEFLKKIEIARKREIHHRIKNNLQVISSLLDLQADKLKGKTNIRDSEVLKAFRESQDRLTSIALIHEELHEGRGTTDTMNFSPYLERLVKNLFQTYRLGSADISLNIELEENILFDMDIAVPLGIIINELVSNSLKYAFPSNDKGEIQIKLCREESSEYGDDSSGSKEKGYSDYNFILTVSDNGIGIPEDFNSEDSDSLGLQLVEILVDQLNGELELRRNNGTAFIIRFTVTEKKTRHQRQPLK